MNLGTVGLGLLFLVVFGGVLLVVGAVVWAKKRGVLRAAADAAKAEATQAVTADVAKVVDKIVPATPATPTK